MEVVMKNSLLVLAVVFLLMGCNKNDNPVSSDGTPIGPGSLTGTVSLFHYTGEIFTPDNSGVTVSLEGTKLSAVTDMSGSWTIKGLNDNTSYTVVYSKSGYNTYKQPALLYKLGVTDWSGGNIVFYRTPAYYYTQSTITSKFQVYAVPGYEWMDHTYIEINGGFKTGTFNGPGEYYLRARVFISPTADVSSDPSKYTFSAVSAITSPEDYVDVDSITFHQNGFITGQQVYAVVYCEWYNAGSYADPVTGKNVYPALNPTPSNVVTIKIP